MYDSDEGELDAVNEDEFSVGVMVARKSLNAGSAAYRERRIMGHLDLISDRNASLVNPFRHSISTKCHQKQYQ